MHEVLGCSHQFIQQRLRKVHNGRTRSHFRWIFFVLKQIHVNVPAKLIEAVKTKYKFDSIERLLSSDNNDVYFSKNSKQIWRY